MAECHERYDTSVRVGNSRIKMQEWISILRINPIT